MAAADQSIAMMDGTYFVGRKEILDWVNGVCETSLSKVEQTCNGAIACMLLDAIYPGKVPMSKVDWSANKDYEYVQNYKILQKCFTTLKIDKFIEVDRLIRGKYQDNLEFMQWFKRFYELNASGAPYDATGIREKGKGGVQYTAKFGGVGGGPPSAPSPGPAPIKKKPTSATGVAPRATATRTATTTTKGPPAAPSTIAGRATSAPSPQLQKELAALQSEVERLTNENGEQQAQLESIEKERDFYFQKLRQIEDALNTVEGGETNDFVQSLFKILYAPDESGDGAEPMDHEM